MPLPVGQIAVFTAVTVPYIVLLTLFGLPFNHSLFWLYVLPPGLLTWLATRPVLESKRLPELLISQARYVGEPSTWCRMAPLAEKDQVVMYGLARRALSRGRAVGRARRARHAGHRHRGVPGCPRRAGARIRSGRRGRPGKRGERQPALAGPGTRPQEPGGIRARRDRQARDVTRRRPGRPRRPVTPRARVRGLWLRA